MALLLFINFAFMTFSYSCWSTDGALNQFIRAVVLIIAIINLGACIVTGLGLQLPTGMRWV